MRFGLSVSVAAPAAYIAPRPPPSEAPVNLTAPVVEGAPTPGQSLTVSAGAWANLPILSYARQWKRNGVAIPGAVGNTYLVTTNDRGTNLTCEVIASNYAGPSVAVHSGGVAVSVARTISNAWTGLLETDGVTVAHHLSGPTTHTRLVVSTSSNLANPTYSDWADTAGQTAKHTIHGLTANTQYWYGLEVSGDLVITHVGKFKTAPVGPHASFRFALGNCHTGNSNAIFTAVKNKNPLFFQHLGDFHYGDIDVADPAPYHTVLNGRFGPTLGPLLREVPFMWTPGDHDFCNDGSDVTSVGRQAWLDVYNNRVPLPASHRFATGPSDPVGYRYRVGRVVFLIPDQRSARVGNSQMFGAAQKAWLLSQFTAPENAGCFFVYGSESPLKSEYSTTDRTDIANAIKAAGLEGAILCIAGDAHSTQIDDGRNFDFASGGGAKMPMIHAGALGQGSSFKGGLFSHGAFYVDFYQAGMIDVTDPGGDTIDLLFTGFLNDGSPFVQFPFQLSLNGYIAPPYYQVATSTPTAAEGSTITVTITSNMPHASVTVDLTGISLSDLASGTLSRIVSLDENGAGTFDVQLADDGLAEPTETLRATIRNTGFFATTTISDAAGQTLLSGTAGGASLVSATLLIVGDQALAGVAFGAGEVTGALFVAGQTPLAGVAAGFGAVTGALTNAPSGSFDPEVVQSVYSATVGISTSLSASLGTPATAGNLLIAYAGVEKTSGAIGTPSGWTKHAEHTSGAGVSGAIFTKVAGGGETAVTIDWATSAQAVCVLLEVSDVDTVDQLHMQTANASTTTRSVSLTTPGATSDANELALGFVHNDSASTSSGATMSNGGIGWSSGWSLVLQQGFGSGPTYSTTVPAFSVGSLLLTATGVVSASHGYGGGSSDEQLGVLITLRKAT